MHSYTSKPTTVKAVQYTAPDGAEQAGNQAEIEAVAPVRQQTPWDPAGGQNCLIVDVGGSDALLKDGGYLVQSADGTLSTHPRDEFEADYVVPKATAKGDTTS